MEVVDRLDALVRVVEDARGMPMSASCVVNRAEVLDLLAAIRAALPNDIGLADAVLAERQQVLDDAQAEADRVVAEARQMQDDLVSQSAVTSAAHAEAARILDEARLQAGAVRDEIDEYVDVRLGNFELVLERITGAVQEARQRMRGTGAFDEAPAAPSGAGPDPSAD